MTLLPRSSLPNGVECYEPNSPYVASTDDYDVQPAAAAISNTNTRRKKRRSPSKPSRSGSRSRKNPPLNYHYDDYNNLEDRNVVVDDYAEEEEDVYIVRQQYGYFSILFSLVQTVILGLMMWQCGVAPLNINPMVGPYPDALSEWGGKNAVLILEDGEWYRLLTPILLHAGVIHLLGNVAVQLEMGHFFEKEWGSLRWIIIYIGSAFGSSILSVICMPQAVSVGSSGAVMGVFGAKLAEVILRACERKVTKQQRIGHEVRQEQCFAVTCSVIVVMLFSFIPYVDWAAHLGGLVAGFVIGIAMFATEVESHFLKVAWFLVGIAATLITFAVSLDYMYEEGNVEIIEELRDVCGYYTENFEDYECNCMRDEYNFALNNNQGGGEGEKYF